MSLWLLLGRCLLHQFLAPANQPGQRQVTRDTGWRPEGTSVSRCDDRKSRKAADLPPKRRQVKSHTARCGPDRHESGLFCPLRAGREGIRDFRGGGAGVGPFCSGGRWIFLAANGLCVPVFYSNCSCRVAQTWSHQEQEEGAENIPHVPAKLGPGSEMPRSTERWSKHLHFTRHSDHVASYATSKAFVDDAFSSVRPEAVSGPALTAPWAPQISVRADKIGRSKCLPRWDLSGQASVPAALCLHGGRGYLCALPGGASPSQQQTPLVSAPPSGSHWTPASDSPSRCAVTRRWFLGTVPEESASAANLLSP